MAHHSSRLIAVEKSTGIVNLIDGQAGSIVRGLMLRGFVWMRLRWRILCILERVVVLVRLVVIVFVFESYVVL